MSGWKYSKAKDYEINNVLENNLLITMLEFFFEVQELETKTLKKRTGLFYNFIISGTLVVPDY